MASKNTQGAKGALALTANWKSIDDVFFSEWNNRAQGSRRSIHRARQISAVLKLEDLGFPIVMVVGSKGKGTAATYVSAALAALNLKVVTITSPALLVNNERIRLNGEQISDADFAMLGVQLSKAMSQVPVSESGYLSPTGAYTVAGVLFAKLISADVLVMEEGLGGLSDEISIFKPRVLVVTPIFLEHTGILGTTVPEIAEDLLGVCSPETQIIVSAPQVKDAMDVIQSKQSRLLELQHNRDLLPANVSWPAGLSKENAELGVLAAFEMLKVLKIDFEKSSVVTTLNTVTLPGRLSIHTSESGSLWVVDSAISGDGTRAARAFFEDNLGTPDVVLASFPDDKGVADCYSQLQGLKLVAVAADSSNLRYQSEYHPQLPVSFLDVVKSVDHAGKKILAVGTISFVGEVLDYLGVNAVKLFDLKSK